jgi:membrane-bound serine protease (ClpP class)
VKSIRLTLLLFGLLLAFQTVSAQSQAPLALVLTADGPISPAMQEYIQRGIRTADQRQAEVLIIQLSTPGGDLNSMNQIVQDLRASHVPVVVYIAPRGAWAGSAGSIVTLAGHVAAMAPETAIGAASPVGSQGENLGTTEQAKVTEIMKATVRSLAERRGSQAVQLAQDMITNAQAVSATEALDAHLVDFIANDVPDLLGQMDGFQVETADGSRTLHTSGASPDYLGMSLIEQLLLTLTDPNIVFILLDIGVTALFIELSHPGGWVAGFVGVVCLALAIYGLGILPVNWFGLIFMVLAFGLFVLDIKAPTHGALTVAGVVSFIVGTLVLFNSPGTPQFQRVSVPLVVLSGIAMGGMFALIVSFALRAQRLPVRTGREPLVGRVGIARTSLRPDGQVQVSSELWSAELAEGEGSIRKGERIEVVSVDGLRLRVRKLK